MCPIETVEIISMVWRQGTGFELGSRPRNYVNCCGYAPLARRRVRVVRG